MGAKTERFGVSMDGDILALIDKVAGSNRSAYIEELARRDLQAKGLLDNIAEVQAMARAQAIVDAAGATRALEIFDRAAAEIAADAAPAPEEVSSC